MLEREPSSEATLERWRSDGIAPKFLKLTGRVTCRLGDIEACKEAGLSTSITSRPWLMTSVGRRTEHAGQTTLTLTGLHADFEKARAALMRVSALLQEWVKSVAEQFEPSAVWRQCCNYLKRILGLSDHPSARSSPRPSR